jgi:hypothetical protein
MFRSKRPSMHVKNTITKSWYKYLLTNTKMYIDLLKYSYLKFTTISIFNKVLFNVCLNLKPIWFVSLHSSLQWKIKKFYSAAFAVRWSNLFGKAVRIFNVTWMTWISLCCRCCRCCNANLIWKVVDVCEL